MLFDEYRKILDFKIVEVSFDELNNGTMRLAEFISSVNGISETEINYLALGIIWDKVENSYNSAVRAFNNLQNFKELTVSQEINNKYKNYSEKIPFERKRRLQEINKTCKKVEELISIVQISIVQNVEDSDDIIINCEKNFSNLANSMNDYAGEYDKRSREFIDYANKAKEFKVVLGKHSVKKITADITRLTQEIVNTQCTESFISDINNKMTIIDSEIKKFRVEFGSLNGFNSELKDLESIKQKLYTEFNYANEDYMTSKRISKIVNCQELKTLTEYNEVAAERIKEVKGLFNEINKIAHIAPKLVADFREKENTLEKLKKEKQSALRVQTVNDSIEKLMAVKLTVSNYKDYRDDFELTIKLYGELDSNEKGQINKYKEFIVKHKQIAVFAKKESKLELQRKKKQKRVAMFLDWASTFFVVIILVGICVGIYFMTKSSWFFKAPKWCLFHKVRLWQWHNWGTGKAFGITDTLMISEINVFWQIILWIPCVLLDLVVYILQVVWWILIALSWPIRWALSRIAGLILYGLAYGLTGIVTLIASYVIAMLDFTKKTYVRCRVVNIVIAVGIMVINYVFMFAL